MVTLPDCVSLSVGISLLTLAERIPSRLVSFKRHRLVVVVTGVAYHENWRYLL